MLSDECDHWECKMGEMVSKSNFLGIYGWVCLCALTQIGLLIWLFNQMSFWKWICPQARKNHARGHLPAIMGSKVDILAKLLQDLSVGPVTGANSEMNDVEGHMMVENEVLGST